MENHHIWEGMRECLKFFLKNNSNYDPIIKIIKIVAISDIHLLINRLIIQAKK